MDKQHLQELFRAPFDRIAWQQVLTDVFRVTHIRHEPRQLEDESNEKVEGYEVGWLDTADGYHIGIYEFEIKRECKIEMNRVGLRGLVKGFTKYHDDVALVVFYNKSQWRLSFICDLKQEKTAPKRFTYVFGNPTETYRTPADRLQKLQDGEVNFDTIRNAFSVEQLNKDFFKGYKAQFAKFCAYMCAGREETKQDRDYVKKLLGRLVFLQFLQKKGWMGVPATKKDWTGGDHDYLQKLIKRHEGNKRLLSDVLEPLFFNTLNNKRVGDIADSLLGDNVKIPYLNGGLFDNDDCDRQNIDFPYAYFAELADFFSQYNFTIDENDPDDSEVGIDPEMLGHIFENLLEDNKDKGAFYTPKEIVHYMCRESLVQYLRSNTDEELHTATDRLVRESFVEEALQKRENAVKVNNLLKEVKVCDPAIGSGAFPMGLLSEIFKCRRLIYGHMNCTDPFSPSLIKREIIQNNIYGVDIEQGAVDIARLRFWLSLVVDEPVPQPLPNLDYKIMQGNSLLESFEGEDLSILYKDDDAITDLFSAPQKRQDIIELQTRYFDTTDPIEKASIKSDIDAIIVGHIENSLRQKQKLLKKQASHTREIIANFKEALDSSSIVKGRQVEYRKRIDKEKKLLATLDTKLRVLDDKSQRLKLIGEDNRPYFLWHLFFKDVFQQGGFDIVIGNPPYIQLQKDGGQLAKDFEGEGFKTFARTGDIYCLFYEKGINILSNGGVEAFITSSKWMRAAYGENTRRFFASQNPLKLIDVGAKVFDSATVDTNILLLQKGPNCDQLQAVEFRGNLKELDDVQLNPMAIPPVCEPWTLLSLAQQSIKQKIEEAGTPLKDWDLRIYFGVKTGYNEAFIIDTAKRDELVAEDMASAELIKPLLRGKDIDYYASRPSGHYLISTFPALEIDIERYPPILEYLLSFGRRLHQTGEDGCRKWTTHSWFETQDPIAYHEELGKEKIVWKRIGSILRFCYDDTGSVVLDSTCFASGPNSKYLVAVLNSRMGHYLLKDAPKTGTGDLLISVQALEPVRIPMLSPADQQPFITLVDKILQAKKSNHAADTSALEAEIDAMVYALYNLTPDEIAIIENK